MRLAVFSGMHPFGTGNMEGTFNVNKLIRLMLPLLLSSLFLSCSSNARAGVVYEVQPVSFGANGPTTAVGINAAGTVIANSRPNGPSDVIPLIWSNGSIVPINIPGDRNPTVSAINDSGSVVGHLRPGGGDQVIGFVRDAAGERDLLGVGGVDAIANDINNQGEIVGTAFHTDGSTQAVIWRKGKPSEIDVEPGFYGSAVAINQRGDVLGKHMPAYPGDPNVYKGFVWSNGKVIDLPTVGVMDGVPYSSSIPDAINDSGEVAGRLGVSSNQYQAAIWINGQATDLGTLPGDVTSEATAVNDSGMVVGFSEGKNGTRPFIYQNGKMSLLDDLLTPDSDMKLSAAIAINNSGQILAIQFHPGVAEAAFLLTPHAVPLPPAGWMALASLPIVWIARRRAARI
jgi:probable HAF family extracellular repeat protein